MRQIKFRAQDIASNKWLYGDLRHHKDDVCIFEQGGTKGEQVKRDTIGQFVGLKDKNGKEIYEGDVMRDDEGLLCEVVWDEFSCGFRKYEHVTNLMPSIIEGEFDEVIGNIHDNPELLNKKINNRFSE